MNLKPSQQQQEPLANLKGLHRPSMNVYIFAKKKLFACLVTRKENVELAFDHDTSLSNVLFKMVHRGELQEEMFFENRTYFKVIAEELPLTLQPIRKIIELSLRNQTLYVFEFLQLFNN